MVWEGVRGCVRTCEVVEECVCEGGRGCGRGNVRMY